MDNYRIASNFDLPKKSKIVDEVSDMSKKMKLKYQSVPEADRFGDSIRVNRLIKKEMPTKSSMIGRKNIAFSSLLE
jgi:hypothetical protein